MRRATCGRRRERNEKRARVVGESKSRSEVTRRTKTRLLQRDGCKCRAFACIGRTRLPRLPRAPLSPEGPAGPADPVSPRSPRAPAAPSTQPTPTSLSVFFSSTLHLTPAIHVWPSRGQCERRLIDTRQVLPSSRRSASWKNTNTNGQCRRVLWSVFIVHDVEVIAAIF